MTIGIRDRAVIKAFVAGQEKSGHKLSTDGITLDGHWLGGSKIAERSILTGFIRLNDLGSKAAQTVHRAIRKIVDPRDIGPFQARPRRRSRRS